jgi:hypothetical protein
MTLTTNGWKAARTLVAACAAVVAFAGAASAQMALSFKNDKDFFGPGGEMTVSVTVPAGGRIVSPRLHHVREGEPLPKNGSRGWIEFPELTSNQELTIRAPQEEGDWWLVMFDGKRLVSRITFDVFDLGTVLELMHRRICRDIKNDQGLISDGCEQYFTANELAAVASSAPAPQTQPLSPVAAPAPAATAKRLRLLSSGAIRADARIEVGVSDAGQKRALELRWANTADLPFAGKKLAPLTGQAFSVRTGQSSTTVIAPADAGDYDLLLFGDGELLEALLVSVQ